MRTGGARSAWVVAASFLLGTIWLRLVTQAITVHGRPDYADFPNRLTRSSRTPAPPAKRFPRSSAYTAPLRRASWRSRYSGPILAGRDGSVGTRRATRLAVLFLVAGTIGILSQVIYLGGKEVATAPYYCDCDSLEAELVSRGAVLDVLGGVQSWMTDAFSLLFAIGLFAAASLARASGWGAGFVRASVVLAVLGLASAAWSRIAVPLLVNAEVHIDYYGIGLLILAVIAGVALPIWGVILGRTLTRPADVA